MMTRPVGADQSCHGLTDPGASLTSPPRSAGHPTPEEARTQMSFDEQLQPVLDVAAEHAVSVDRDGRFPEEAIGTLRASGLLGLTLPVSIGGLDGSPADFLSVARSLASRCASTAIIYLMHVCAAQVALAGTPDAGVAGLRSMADGTNLSTLAFSERGSRSHFWAPVSQQAGTKLFAEKSFVTASGHADSYVVSTRPERADSPLESTLYLVPSSTAGITAGPAWDGLGLRGNASAPMTFDVDVDDSMQLGEAGKGLDLMLGVVLPWFQLGQGAVSVGIAEAAQSAAVAHVTAAKFEHLGQTLADLPTVRARLGRAQTEIDTVAGSWPTSLAGWAKAIRRCRSCRRKRRRTRWRSGSRRRPCRCAAAWR